ncbi:hypothetical protein [Thalassovita sp.]|jgi:hypothetical protein|uniref:hypothetical protein n=1 Tax=Thalassovita sp. TaxID=1979401 RepID=UPI003B58F4EA
MKATNVPAVFAGVLAASFAGSLAADPVVGEKEIYLVSEGDSRIKVGSVRFEKEAQGSRYTLQFDEVKFADHFLSMRPFKCLEGAQKHWCHVPYPYANRRQVSASDLTDLEYDLLFLWKGATEYGINMWNGVYYQLEIDGDRIVGTLREMDMEVLSAPPDEGNFRPISADDLHEADAASHWLPRLVIE